MTIAFPTTGCRWDANLDEQFGRCAYIGIYNESEDQFVWIENGSGQETASGAGVQTAQKVIDHGASVLIAHTVGPKAVRALEDHGISICCTHKAVTVQEAYHQWKASQKGHGIEKNQKTQKNQGGSI